MDRRQRKAQEKRKKREQAKKKARIEAARRPSDEALLVKAAARSPLERCYVSQGWDDESELPELVSALVARELSAGSWLAMSVLLDRTCLGVKDAMLCAPMDNEQLAELIEELGMAHGGMLECEPLVAQSLVYHALDYAAALGFAPHADFHEAMVGPRPEQLLQTPWCASKKPIYIPGPTDNAQRVLALLRSRRGDDFEFPDLFSQPAQFDGSKLDPDVLAELVQATAESTQVIEARFKGEATEGADEQDRRVASGQQDLTAEN